jgi:predicted DNA-binding protein (MmcQ/YjbR family)
MNIEELREYCLSKVCSTEGLPFGETTLVFKVKNKMFALLNLEEPHSVNLKCDPDLAIDLRERYQSVLPGYHMNKRYWNTIILDGQVSVKLVCEWIDHSYDQVKAGLSKRDKAALTMNKGS